MLAHKLDLKHPDFDIVNFNAVVNSISDYLVFDHEKVLLFVDTKKLKRILMIWSESQSMHNLCSLTNLH